MHVVVGPMVFAVLAAPANLLNWAIMEIEAYHRTDVAIIWGLRSAFWQFTASRIK